MKHVTARWTSLLPILLFVAAGWQGSARAQSISWTGASPNGANWHDFANWNPGVVPTAADIAVFNLAIYPQVPIVDTPAAVLGIVVGANSGNITIAGGANTLTIGASGIDLSAAPVGLTLNCAIVIGAGQTWNSGPNTLGINNPVTRSGSATLVFSGAGSFIAGAGVLSKDGTGIIGTWATIGANPSFAYATNNAGTIAAYTGTPAANGASLTDTTGTVNYDLSSGGGSVANSFSANTIRYVNGVGGGTTAPGASFTVNGLMQNGAGAWTIGTNTITIGANKELDLFSNDKNMVITSPIQNNGSNASALVAGGSGIISLSAVNSYTGPTTVSSGTLSLDANASLFPGTIAVGSSITVNQGAALVANKINSIGYTNVHANDTLTINSGGIFKSVGFVNTVSYKLNVTGGSLTSSGAGDAVYGNFYFDGPVVPVHTFTSAADGTPANLSGSKMSINGTVTFNVIKGGGAVDLNENGILFLPSLAGITVGAIVKSGNGVMVVSGANIYPGGTTINAGTVRLAGSGTLGANGTLTFGAAAPSGTLLQLNGAGLTVSGLNTNATPGAPVIEDGGAGSALTVNNTTASVYAGTLQDGTGGGKLFLVKSGSGSLALTGLNTYTGSTTINGGFLSGTIASDTTVSAAGNFGPGTLSTPGTLTINSANAPFTAQSTAALNFRLTAAPSNGGGAGNDYVNAPNGPVALAANSVINISSGSNFNLGTYTLISGTSLTVGGSATAVPTVGTTPPGVRITLTNTGTALQATASVDPGNKVWKGTNGADASWSNGANWLGGAAPVGDGSETLYFSSTANAFIANNDLVAGKQYVQVQVSVGGFTITGNSITLASGSAAFNINTSSGNTTLGLPIDGAGAGLTVAAPGGIILINGVETYTGPTIVNAGTLRMSSSLAFSPVAANSESFYAPDVRSPVHAIDGSGMTPNNPLTVASTCGNSPGFTMWLSNGNVTTWIAFDLGSVRTIAGFHLWNYNEVNGSPEPFTKRGIKTAGIYVCPSLPAQGASYGSQGPNLAGATLAQNMTFSQATSLTNYMGEDYTFTTPVTGRYIEMYVTSKFGTSDGYTGIAEILFSPASVTPSFSSTTTLQLAAGSTFDLNGFSQTFASLTGATGSFITLGNGTLTTDGSTTVASVLSGTGNFVKTGAGTILLSAANTYTGSTTVNGGTLKAGVASVANTSSAFGLNSAVVLSGAAGTLLDINGFNTAIGSLTGGGPAGGNLALGSATLTVGSDNTSPPAYAGAITGTGGLTKVGTGTLTLSGLNTYTGGTTVSSSTLKAGSTSAFGNNSAVALLGTLDISGFDNAIGSITGPGSVILGANTLTIGGDNTTPPAFTGIISGAGGITKTGTGTLMLANTSTYLGTTLISNGTVQLAALRLPLDPINATSESYYMPDNRAPINAVNGSGMTPNNPVTFTSTCGTGAGSQTMWLSNGNTTTWIAFDLGSTQTLSSFHLWNYNEGGSVGGKAYTGRGVNTCAFYVCPSLPAQGATYNTQGPNLAGATLAQNFTFTPATGQTTYAGEDYTFTTPVTARYLELYVTGVGNFGAASPDGYTGISEIRFVPSSVVPNLPSGTALQLASGGTFDVNGVQQTVSSVTGPSGSFVKLGSGTLTAGSGVFDGVISGAGGSLIKTGSGALKLTGVNTYSGLTTVNAGSLVVGTSAPGSSAAIATAVTVNGSGTGTPAASGTQIRGTGTVGAITALKQVNGDAVIWPGVGTVTSAALNETLTCSSATIINGGKLAIVLASNGGGGGAGVTQKLVVMGAAPALGIDNTSILSIAADSASQLKTAAANGQYVIAETRTAGGALTNGISTAFTTANINSGSLVPGTAFNVLYLDSTGATVATDPNGGSVSAAQIVLQFNNVSVTPVRIDAFSAESEGAGVLLSWNCVSEFQNAGFNVYRRALGNGSWNKVNPALIAGRVSSPDQKTYRLYDWTAAGVYEYRLESISIAGVAENYMSFAGPMVTESGVGSVTAVGIDAALSSLIETAQVQRARDINAAYALEQDHGTDAGAQTNIGTETTGTERVSTALRSASIKSADVKVFDLGGSAAVAHTSVLPVAPASASTSFVAARWFSGSNARTSSVFTGAKVNYNQAGVLLIRRASLPAGMDIDHVAVQREGRAISALAATPDGLLVYGQGYEDDYTNIDALFLRPIAGQTAAGSIIQAQGLFASTQTANVESPATVTASYHDVYFDYNNAFRPYTFAPWFSGQYLTSSATDGTVQSFSVSTPFASGSAAALTVNAWSLTQSPTVAQDHALQVIVNGQSAGQAVWSGGNRMVQLTFQVPSGALKAGANAIDLVTSAITGVDSQIAFLHSIKVSYTRSLDGSKPVTISNTSSAIQLYELSNLLSANVWVVDTRYADRAALIAYESQRQADGTYKVRFNAAGGGTGQYQVVPAGMENAPLSVARRTVKPIKLAGVYLATGPSQFSAGIQSLLMERSKEGLRGQFVDQEVLFDNYNYGRYGPAGIQNAVRSLRPQYLLLLGRTTYDYKNYSGANVDPLCPAFLVSTTFWAQATSDALFGDLGRGYPEVAIGRLPVTTAAELSTAVQHILNYAGAPSSGIRVHAVADQTDPQVADFSAQANSLSQSFPDMTWQANYLGTTYATAPEVTNALTTAADGGADWIVYIGHGNAAHLGNETPSILDTTSVQNWKGDVVFLQSTCTANWMAKDVADYKSIAIQALTQPQGGISASIGTSTYMNSSYAVPFMAQLMKTADAAGMRWGNALMRTQQWAFKQGAQSSFYSDLGITEQIFGDPAMPVYSRTQGTLATTPAVGNF